MPLRELHGMQVAAAKGSIGFKSQGSLTLRFLASGRESGFDPTPRYFAYVAFAWALAVWEGFPRPRLLDTILDRAKAKREEGRFSWRTVRCPAEVYLHACAVLRWKPLTARKRNTAKNTNARHTATATVYHDTSRAHNLLSLLRARASAGR